MFPMYFFARNCLVLIALALLSWTELAISADWPTSFGRATAIECNHLSSETNLSSSSSRGQEASPEDVRLLGAQEKDSEQEQPAGDDGRNDFEEEIQELAYLAPLDVQVVKYPAGQDYRDRAAEATPRAVLRELSRPPQV